MIKDKKIIKKISSCMLIVSLFNINSYASDEIEVNSLVHKSIAKGYGGLGEDYFNNAVSTSDGGFIAVGNSTSDDIGFENSNNELQCIIVKYDKYGNEEWSRNILGNGYEELYGVTELKDGSFIIAGYSSSTNLGFTNNGDVDFLYAKYNSKGDLEWIKNWGGSSSDEAYSVESTNDGGFIISGQTYSKDINIDGNDIYGGVIIKFNSNGDQEWIKNYGKCFKKAVEMKDGEIIAIGTGDSKDDIIIKYNSEDNIEWVTNSEIGIDYKGSLNDIIETSDGGFTTVGYTTISNSDIVNKGNRDGVIIKYDKNGVREWINSWGGSSNDLFKSLIEDNDNNLIVAGSSFSVNTHINNNSSDAIIVKYDSSGNLISIDSWGGSSSDIFEAIIKTENNGFIAVGMSASNDTDMNFKGDEDGLIIKYDDIIKANESLFTDIKDLDNIEDLSDIREKVNLLPESELKDYLSDKLNSKNLDIGILELKNSTANLDVYIKSENMLNLSLDTNSITFEDFSGVDNLELNNVINITVNSSLPYRVSAYLVTEIENVDKSKIMNREILNIKASEENNYNHFIDLDTPIILLDNKPSGNGIIHSIDLMLKGGLAFEKDIYKTVIKFEAEQK